jgi:hypothetical protein
MLKDGAIGFISSSVATTLIYPIDVIKTNFQMHTEKIIRPSPINIASDIFKTKGILGFYRGISPQIMTYPIFWSVFFPTKALVEKYKVTNNYFADKMVASYVSATVGSTIANPLFVIKTNMQVAGLPSIHTVTKQLYADSGLRWITRGWTATMLNNNKLCVQFPLYDVLREKYNIDVISSSFISKAVTTSIYYPLDLIRTKQRNLGNLTIRQAFYTIFTHGGIIGLYRGVMLNFVVSTPNFILTMWFKDILDNLCAT